MIRSFVALLLTLASASAADIHYAPAENLEHIDVAALSTATKTIDIAAYVMTDHPVIDALEAAAKRGVAVRVYVDGGQAGHAFMAPDSAFGVAYNTPGISLRAKHAGRPIMHLKSYCVDGHLFRTGSANFSASGLKQQDNDLLLFDDPAMCGAFERDFAQMWDSRDAE